MGLVDGKDKIQYKNYSLYVEYANQKILIYKGTLKEIDDFTSHFIDKNAIKRLLVEKEKFKDCDVYIESAGNKKYNLLYYSNREVINPENSEDIIDMLHLIDPIKVDKFLYDVLNLKDCLNSSNSHNIPIVKLHYSIINGDYSEYYRILKGYSLSSYNFLRRIVIYFFKNSELKRCTNRETINKKDEIITIMNEIKEKLDAIECDNVSDESIIDDFAYSIMSSDQLEYEEKIKELYMLYNSMEVVNGVILKYENKMNLR